MMAMAETEKLNNERSGHSRRREQELPSPSMAARPTKHLEFNQAMSDFKFMFPNMEEDVIEAVLRANNGIVDATIDQLLTMNVDSEEITQHLQWIGKMDDEVDSSPTVEKLSSPHPIEDSPPPYSEAIQSSQMLLGATGSTKKLSMKKRPLEPAASHLLDMGIDELALSNTEPKTAVSPWSSPISSLSQPRYSHKSTKKPSYRNWNPPLLGTLPDDFLRLSPAVSHPVKRTSSSSSSHEKSHHRKLSSKSMILSAHDFSTGMLQEKMKENERRRKLASCDIDPELAQYLEDERLAIMFQNSEFLQELRDDEDFMNTLESDRMSTSGFELKTPSTPEKEAMIEGYGTDRQDTLEAFPFSQQLPKSEDEDAELRRKLRHMGKASRKQFAALARRFFSRKKKKTSKQILKEKLAPSMMNLLDAETYDDTDEPQSEEVTYNSEETPSDTINSVPSYRTVQRPMYEPDTLITYNPDKSHMV